ncbi:MAG: phosphatidate cytidylyltransferase [Thermodesulfobacteriota bacterium]
MAMHMKRIITAFIGILFLIGVIKYAPSWVFIIFILFAALISLNEFYALMKPNITQPIVFINYILTAILFFYLLINNNCYIALFPFFVIVPLAYFMVTYQKSHHKMGDIGKLIMGPLYICLPLALLAIISKLPRGHLWIFFILAVIFAGDTGSFYCGKFFGKHKLSQISPGKTWEGAIGGLMANVACAGIFYYVFLTSLSGISIIVLGIAMGISGQIGDLAESMLKRISNKKDSGTILPGHGGMLDRIDSLLFAIPVLSIYLKI